MSLLFTRASQDVAAGPSAFSPGNAITIFAWAKLQTLASNPRTFASHDNGAGLWRHQFYGAGVPQALALYVDGATSGNGTWRTAVGSLALAIGAWTSIAVTFDFTPGDTPTFYINGVAVATDSSGDSRVGGSTADGKGLFIGNDGSRSYGNDGYQAHTALWTRRASADEILQVHRHAPASVSPGLVAYYPEHGAATDLKDYSGSGNDLTSITGATINASNPDVIPFFRHRSALTHIAVPLPALY